MSDMRPPVGASSIAVESLQQRLKSVVKRLESLETADTNQGEYVSITHTLLCQVRDSARFVNDLQVISHTLPIRPVHNLSQPLTFSPTLLQ